MIIAGSAYGVVLILFGVSDLMAGKWIFGSLYIAVAVFLITVNLLARKRNRKFYKKYFSDRENDKEKT